MPALDSNRNIEAVAVEIRHGGITMIANGKLIMFNGQNMIANGKHIQMTENGDEFILVNGMIGTGGIMIMEMTDLVNLYWAHY